MSSIPERIAEIDGVTAEQLERIGECFPWAATHTVFREAAAILRKRGPTVLHRMATKAKAEAQRELTERHGPYCSCVGCVLTE